MTGALGRAMTGALGRPLWLAAVTASAGAGLIHLAHGPAHLEELGALGAGFYLAATLQLGWAAVALATLAGFRSRASSRRVPGLVFSGIAINGAILAAWAMSRSVGLPAGSIPWTPEAIGSADAISTILEGLLVVGLFAAQRGWAMPRLPRVQALATAGATVAILLIATGTAVAISPSETDHAHPPGYEHEATDGHHAAGEPTFPIVESDTEQLATDDAHAEPDDHAIGDDLSVGEEHAVGEEHVESDHHGEPAGS